MLARYGLIEYLTGSTLARAGDDMSGPALLLFVVAVSGSGAQASLVYGGLTIAAGLGGPLFGVLLDRAAYPGRVLAGAIFAYAVGLAGLTLLVPAAPLAVSVVVAVAVGLLAPALAGGWTSQLSGVVPAARLGRAHALDAGTYNLASLIGPALAAGVAAATGAGWAVAGAVGALFAAVPFAARLPPRKHVARSSRLTFAAVGDDLVAGARAIANVPGLRAITAASSIAYFGYGMFVVACPILGLERLGAADRGVLLLSVAAAAALLATGAMARYPPRCAAESTFVAATSVAALAFLFAALTSGPVALVVAIALFGAGEGPQLAAVFAIRQREAPERMRGQIFTTAASLKLSVGALGAVAGGVVLVHGPDVALTIAAVTQVAAVVTVGRSVRSIRAMPIE